mgnify:CR=1 FL=1
MNKYDHSYSAYFNSPNADYPEGSAIDASSEDSLDGTPVLAAWFNDIIGFFQAAFHKAFGNPRAGETVTREVSGVPETAQKSDILDALESIMDKKDSVLDEKINAEKTSRAEDERAIVAMLGEEGTARGEADSALDTKIKAEETARKSKDTDLQNQINAIKNSGSWCPYPVGATYVQFPGCSAPASLWGGTNWQKMDFGGAFFRAEGGNALAFGQVKQAESLPNITGSATLYGAELRNSVGRGTSDGAFRDSYNFGSASGGGSHLSACLDFSAKNSNSTYGRRDEVAPENYTIIIWKRVS